MTTTNVNGLMAGIKKLDGLNYYDWKFDISMVLRRTGSWDVVSGNVTKPDASNKTEVAAWETKAEDGLTVIGLCVDQSQKQYIRDAKDGVEAWTALKNIYEKNTTSMRVSLKRRFFAYRHNIKRPISEYITDITSLASQLRAIGVTLVDQDVTDVLIYALAPEYSDVATALMTRSDANSLKISDVSAALMEAEARRHDANPEDPEDSDFVPDSRSMAMLARDGKKKTCTNCKRDGHTKADCWAKGGGKEGQRKCFSCGKDGHMSRDCPKNEKSNYAYSHDLAY